MVAQETMTTETATMTAPPLAGPFVKPRDDMDATEATYDMDASATNLDATNLEGGSHLDESSQPVEAAAPWSAIIPKLDYASIPSFSNYTELVHDDHYIRLPKDWHVLVADIQGSTMLIEQGRYRDVNTVGVSCIAAVRNALKSSNNGKFNDDFPFVFGGDGASLVVRGDQLEAAMAALTSLQTLARHNYQMHLRVGSVDIAQLEDQGKCVEVARYEIASGMCIAMFRGGGLALADTLVKAGVGQRFGSISLHVPLDLSGFAEDLTDSDEEDASSQDEVSESSEEEVKVPKPKVQEPNLDGLSCRWNKIPSRHGCVLSLLVMHNEDVYANEFLKRSEDHITTEEDEQDNPKTKPSSSEIYKRVLLKLDTILQPENNLQAANPVHPDLADYKTAPEMLADENRLHARRNSSLNFWTSRAVEIGLCSVIFGMRKLQHAIIDAPAYTAAMRTHADHRKFDDMIRMVIDCTNEQADAIEAYLQRYHQRGRKIFYGLQRSQHTIMTCLLEDTNDGNHVHFVDGDLGGYALAAKQLKLQLGNYAMAKRGMNVRLNFQKQHSEKNQKPKRKLRKTITG